VKRAILIICVTVLFCSASTTMAADTYKIGVLAKNGPVKALKMWEATGDYLSSKIPGKAFEVVPLDFDDVNPAIESGKVDFFLVNSSMFVTAKVRYGASAIATMVNSRQGQPLKAFGGVIIAASEDDSIQTLADIKGKTFMAVKKSSFGGWQMAYKTLLDAGIDPAKDFAKLEFGGKHDNVVLAVLNGAADAGTVRTDTLERMAADGDIEMADFTVIAPKQYADFPFVCSTPLYPEWPLAKVKSTPEMLANKVVAALKEMKADDSAAKAAKVVGWVEALDYTPVEELQKSLSVGAYAK
jgi:two-component system sensor histidine kinase TtrS